MFEMFNGLPLHPLVVHAVVVLIPLSAIGAVVVALRPKWARPYGPLVAAGAIAAAVSALVAQQAGNALLAELAYSGEALTAVETHRRWGLFVVIAGICFAVLAVASTAMAFTFGAGNRVQRIVAWLAAALGITATVFAALAGESGAASVWGYVYGSG